MASAPTRDIGHLDQHYGLWLGDWLELIPDLIWPNSVQTYSRMRHDPQLTAVLAAYTLPIRRATWAIDPAGCRDEVVQLVADDLGLPILGADAEPGPARRRGVRWADHVRLALGSLTYGFAPFERRYEIVNGQARLVNLGERLPHTIGAINLHRDGTIQSIQQDIAPVSSPIPAERLAWYVHEREGANWAGRSILRASYGPWLLKHEVWRVHATSIRRFGMGVPSVTAPVGATPGQVAEAQRLASAMRVGDQSGVGMPDGFKLAITGMTGSVPDAMAFIHYLDQQMSRSCLAGLMDLGDTSNGSRALGASFLDLFLLSLQAVADEIADAATSGQPGIPGIVTQLVDYNWGEDEPAPKVVAPDVGDRHEVTAEALDQLITCGAITPDPELEAYVRASWKLPERSQTALPTPPAPRPDPEPTPAPQARRRPRTPRARRPRAAAEEGATRRQLTLDESTSGMDPAAIQQAWQEQLDQLLADWQPIAEAWRAELGEQVEQALEDGDLAALAAMSLDSAAAAALIAAAMVAMAGTASEQMAAEAESQGVTVEAPAVDEEALGAIAAAIAVLLAAWLAGAAAREALRLAVPGAAAAVVAAAVVAFLAGLSDRFLRDQLGAALSQAQASGRFAVLDAAPAADQYIASEVLDAATCGPCRDIDGHTFDDLDAARAAYGNGSYVLCEGGIRCRGTVFALFND
ncbi:hypothetical protein ACIBQX_18780 [Nonomuraea sp. NPDC049714]|uniref:phage portal protein family protein n=1 Tax=Nonomuraea sp. NPDC049714 TaxID=3364357 RepID=UPI003791D5D6